MKNIELTKGKSALVSEKDYEFLMQWKWRFNGYYAMRSIRRRCSETGKTIHKSIYMHREILKSPIGMQVDHINGDKLDNRAENLRAATDSENKRNTGGKGGTSKYKGVAWNKKAGKWAVNIMKEGKYTFLGYFNDEWLAALAYNAEATLLHKEFAKLNELYAT